MTFFAYLASALMRLTAGKASRVVAMEVMRMCQAAVDGLR